MAGDRRDAQLDRVRLVPVHPLLDHPDRPCRGAGVDQFFPRDYERVENLLDRLRTTAEFYCRTCPLQQLCRDTGARTGYGMWGGVLYSTLGDGHNKTLDLLTTTPRGSA